MLSLEDRADVLTLLVNSGNGGGVGESSDLELVGETAPVNCFHLPLGII